MRFMILIYGNDSVWQRLDQTKIDRIGATHRALQEELAESGELVGHDELSFQGTITIRVTNESVIATEGPFELGSFLVGGFYIVDCMGRERAVEIAGRFLEAEFAPVEVRQLTGTTVWDKGVPRTLID